MQELQQLIKSLSKSEVNFVKHYYRFNTDKKRHQLFNLVYASKVETDEDAAKILYGKKGAAYSHLKSRLKKDILNLLLFQDGEKQSESELFQAQVEVIRLILKGKILLVRKVHNLGVKVLKEAIELAEKYELLSEKVIASDILGTRLGVKSGLNHYLEHTNPSLNDLGVLKEIYLAKKEYYSIVLPINFAKNQDDNYIKQAKYATNKLKLIYEESQSPNVGYYYYLTSIVYYNLSKNYEMLYDYANDFLHLLESSDVIKSNARLINGYLQVYSACMHLGRYDESFETSSRAREYATKNGPNELTVLEYMFLAALRANDLNNLTDLLNECLKHPQIAYSKNNQGKWIFYHATFYFKSKMYSESIAELQKENALLKDKSGWLFGHKLLEIMCYMELEEFDMIEFRVEALRKLLQRQKDKNITRMKTVFNILTTFTKTGASYKKTFKEEVDNFDLLIKGEGDYFWNPLGYEIIRFDTWFQNKIQ